MEQASIKSACLCCGLISPFDQLHRGNDLLYGNNIELEQLDSASSDGCKFCQFLATLLRYNMPQQYRPAQFRFNLVNGTKKLSEMSFQPLGDASREWIQIFRFKCMFNEIIQLLKDLLYSLRLPI